MQILSAQETGVSRTISGDQLFETDVIVEGLHVVGDIEQINSDVLMVAERGGRVLHVTIGENPPTEAAVQEHHTIENIYAVGQGGLLDIALGSDYSNTGILFVVYTTETRKGVVTRLSRFTDTTEGWTNEVILYDADPVGANKHYGSAVTLLPDRTLLFSLGERGNLDLAQNLGTLHGKTIRLTRDGRVPRDNPFIKNENALNEIYTYGHRNPQGLAVHPETGRVYAIEHGPSGYDRAGGGDEINLLSPGENFGWPIIHHKLERRNMVTPMVEYTPATAPSAGIFYTSRVAPWWTNDLFVANLRGQSLLRLKITEDRVIDQEFLLEGTFGRIRAVGSDDRGSLYIGTSNGDLRGQNNRDVVVRLTPIASE